MAKNGAGAGDVASAEKVPHWSAIAGLRKTNIEELAEQFEAIDRQIKELEEAKKALKDRVLPMLLKADVKTVQAAGHYVTRVDGRTPRRLNVGKLLKAGVRSTVIERCYDEGHEYTTVKFTKIPSGGGGE